MSSNVVSLPPRGTALLTKKQLAAAIGRSERWIEMRVKDADLPCEEATDRYGRRRYDLAAVQAWMAAGRPKRASTDDRLASLEREVASLRAIVSKLGRTA